MAIPIRNPSRNKKNRKETEKKRHNSADFHHRNHHSYSCPTLLISRCRSASVLNSSIDVISTVSSTPMYSSHGFKHRGCMVISAQYYTWHNPYAWFQAYFIDAVLRVEPCHAYAARYAHKLTTRHPKRCLPEFQRFYVPISIPIRSIRPMRCLPYHQ